jgi:Tol biopolymer transport system component
MHVVRCDLREADGTAESLEPVVHDRGAYVAEASLTTDARHLLFCSLESGGGDLFAMDLANGEVNRLVAADGYDGGPFFSPEQERICYRSDRRGDHLLQLFVSDLAFNDDGTIVGIEREYQLTDDDAVNWCPFWHPNGRYLVYSSSRIGHHNYEIFLIDADPGDRPGSTGTIRYGAGVKRVTHASGSDVLPAFNADGSLMMWTSRRGEKGTVQLWVADFVMDLGGP